MDVKDFVEILGTGIIFVQRRRNPPNGHYRQAEENRSPLRQPENEE